MAHLPIEQTELFKRMEALSDRLWDEVVGWDDFAKSTLGRQLVRAADSVCLNLAEGDGRYSDADALNFFVIARGSLREVHRCVKAAVRRNLTDPARGDEYLCEFDELGRMLNGLIAYRRKTKNVNMVREDEALYEP
jgi:four helix bundle protein